nr:MAG TPA: hypothetical protein [Caudoviricetes sp.]
MWAAIKKAINSNLAKPLDILLGELHSNIKIDIVNIWNKLNEANGNAWNSIQKGQEIVNIMNDTGGKKYTIVRQGSIDSYQRFDYSGGAGVLKSISSLPRVMVDTQVYIDGQLINNIILYSIRSNDYSRYGDTDRAKVLSQLEFKNSISIVNSSNYGSNVSYLIQTEK